MQWKAERDISELLEKPDFSPVFNTEKEADIMFKLLVKCATILAAGEMAYVKR